MAGGNIYHWRIFTCNSAVHYCRHRNVRDQRDISRRKGSVHRVIWKERRRRVGRGDGDERGPEDKKGGFLSSSALFCSSSPVRIFLFCRVDLKKPTNLHNYILSSAFHYEDQCLYVLLIFSPQTDLRMLWCFGACVRNIIIEIYRWIYTYQCFSSLTHFSLYHRCPEWRDMLSFILWWWSWQYLKRGWIYREIPSNKHRKAWCMKGRYGLVWIFGRVLSAFRPCEGQLRSPMFLLSFVAFLCITWNVCNLHHHLYCSPCPCTFLALQCFDWPFVLYDFIFLRIPAASRRC